MSKHSVTPEETLKIRQAFNTAKGIVDHEFPQTTIDSCAADVAARIERIANGQTTFAEEDSALMAEWNRIHNIS